MKDHRRWPVFLSQTAVCWRWIHTGITPEFTRARVLCAGVGPAFASFRHFVVLMHHLKFPEGATLSAH